MKKVSLLEKRPKTQKTHLHSKSKSGIFMNGMERGEALKFEAALKAVGFATTLVADHERPQLHDPIYPSLISHEK